MIMDEEKSLKDNINIINNYLDNHYFLDSFYNEINSLSITSLQDISIEKNLKFFNEINFILSVIISIISHPHLSNKKEGVIVKAGQSTSLKEDSFQKTIKDSRLWKRKKAEMVVEEVYNYVYVDEIKIYENIFVVMVIHLIDSHINKYDEFYNSLISVVNYGVASLTNKNVEEAFDKLNLLKNKIRKIKETYFYKTVNRNFKPINKVQPTNILLKDRLYNLCYKFYKKITTYNDDESLKNDLNTYYFIYLLKVLKNNDFSVLSSLSKKIYKNYIYNTKIKFEKDKFNIVISYDKFNSAFDILIINKDLRNEEAHHLLFVDESNNFSNFVKLNFDELSKSYATIDAISLWNICSFQDDLVMRYTTSISEEKMIENYIFDRFVVVEGSSRIYSKYCPVCKSKNIESENNEYRCLNCLSKYNLYKKNKKDFIFFKNIRRLL